MTRRVLLTALVIAAVGAACGAGTFAAFSSSTTTPSNSFQAGTVSISDSHTGSTSLVSLSNAAPSSSVQSTGCVTVTYGGSLPATVRLYATGVSGAALTPYIKVKITRGSWSGAAPAYPSCTGFVTTGEGTYAGGTAVVYNGTLSGMPTSWATGSDDPAGGTTEQWTNGEAHVYKFEVNVDSAAPASAQGQSASAAFTWEAQNQ